MSASSSLNGPGSVRAAERAKNLDRDLGLRQAGMSYATIARITGQSETTIHRHIRQAIQSKEFEGADNLRRVEGSRLDALQRAHWAAAIQGDIAATNAVLRIMERRARLFGLDSPVQIELATDVDAQIVALAAQVGILDAQETEPDIVDGAVTSG